MKDHKEHFDFEECVCVSEFPVRSSISHKLAEIQREITSENVQTMMLPFPWKLNTLFM